jgi:hypothetical protein
MQPSLVDGAAGGKWQKVAHRAAVVERLGGLAGKLMNREVEGSAFLRIADSGRTSRHIRKAPQANIFAALSLRRHMRVSQAR